MDAQLHEKLAAYVAAEKLPVTYTDLAEQWFLPLAEWLADQRQTLDHSLLVGVHGAQGTGKTTLCRVLELLLAESGWHCLTLSLDDFYYGRDVRQQLGEDIHPLLQTRGVPGTHDIALLLRTLAALREGGQPSLPRFDKSSDDREPTENWPLAGAADIILLEGWCIGCRAEAAEALAQPVNALEQEEDSDMRWRQYVNDCLAGEYADLFAQLDCLVMLQAPSMDAVREWRSLQEQKLAARLQGKHLMDDAGIERFVQHYERLTRHSLTEMPMRADYVLQLASDHSITEALVQ